RPDIHLVRRADVDMDVSRLEHLDQDGEDLAALRVARQRLDCLYGVVRFGEAERRRLAIGLEDRAQLLRVAGLGGLDDLLARAPRRPRMRRGTAPRVAREASETRFRLNLMTASPVPARATRRHAGPAGPAFRVPVYCTERRTENSNALTFAGSEPASPATAS